MQSRRGRRTIPQTCGFWEQVDTEADPCRQRLAGFMGIRGVCPAEGVWCNEV